MGEKSSNIACCPHTHTRNNKSKSILNCEEKFPFLRLRLINIYRPIYSLPILCVSSIVGRYKFIFVRFKCNILLFMFFVAFEEDEKKSLLWIARCSRWTQRTNPSRMRKTQAEIAKRQRIKKKQYQMKIKYLFILFISVEQKGITRIKQIEQIK